MSDEDTPRWPPNYHRANGDIKCENCDAFQNGACTRFHVEVDPDHVCDDWSDTGERDLSKMARLGHVTPVSKDCAFTIFDVESSS